MPPRIAPQKPQYRRTFIRQWREHRGLSQDQLVARMAERVEGFSKSSLSRIENGKQPYSQPILEALAWALQCEPADLLIRNPTDGEALWSIWDGLEPAQRVQATAILEALRKAS